MTSDLAAVPALYWFCVIVSECWYSATVLVSRVLERVRFSQRHVGERELGLRGEQRVGEIGGACLRECLLRLDFAPDLPPDVERPDPGSFGGQGRELGRTALSGAGPVDGRKEPRARLVDKRQRLAKVGLVRLDRLIGHGDDALEPIELRIMKYGPPLAFRLALPRRRDLPALDLLELRRHDRRRPLKVGADRRAAGKRPRDEKRRHARDAPRSASAPPACGRTSRVRKAMTKSPSRPADRKSALSPASFRRHPDRRRKSRRGRSRRRGCFRPSSRRLQSAAGREGGVGGDALRRDYARVGRAPTIAPTRARSELRRREGESARPAQTRRLAARQQRLRPRPRKVSRPSGQSRDEDAEREQRQHHGPIASLFICLRTSLTLMKNRRPLADLRRNHRDPPAWRRMAPAHRKAEQPDYRGQNDPIFRGRSAGKIVQQTPIRPRMTIAKVESYASRLAQSQVRPGSAAAPRRAKALNSLQPSLASDAPL